MTAQRDSGGSSATSLSVLVLAYNQADYLEQCVASVLSTDIDDIDIHILDDGSTDATPEFGTRLAKAYPDRVFFERQENSGNIPANFNRLVARARGRRLTMIAADDFFPAPWRVRHRIERFDVDRNCVLAICQGARSDKDGNLLSAPALGSKVTAVLKREPPETVLHEYLERQHFSFFLQGCILDTEFFRSIGAFDESLMADDLAFNYSIFHAMVEHGARYRFDDEIGWCYRLHGANEHRNHWRQLRRRAEVYGRYVPRVNWHSFEPKLLTHTRQIEEELLDKDKVYKLIEEAFDKEFAERFLYRAIIDFIITKLKKLEVRKACAVLRLALDRKLIQGSIRI